MAFVLEVVSLSGSVSGSLSGSKDAISIDTDTDVGFANMKRLAPEALISF